LLLQLVCGKPPKFSQVSTQMTFWLSRWAGWCTGRVPVVIYEIMGFDPLPHYKHRSLCELSGSFQSNIMTVDLMRPKKCPYRSFPSYSIVKRPKNHKSAAKCTWNPNDLY
jgi:hypothetical protein